MSIKERGRNAEKKVVSGSKTVGRDVRKAGTRLAKGARTVGRDVEKAGRRVGKATRNRMTRVDAHLRPKHVPKARAP